jgi:hypothetical protein
MRTFAAALTLTAGLASAAPAQASAGLFCEPSGGRNGSGPTMSLVITRGLPGGIFGVSLADRSTDRTTMGDAAALVLVQAWIDERQVLVDVADKDVMRYIAKLRARTTRDGGTVGTLEYEGRSYRVKCEESG